MVNLWVKALATVCISSLPYHSSATTLEWLIFIRNPVLTFAIKFLKLLVALLQGITRKLFFTCKHYLTLLYNSVSLHFFQPFFWTYPQKSGHQLKYKLVVLAYWLDFLPQILLTSTPFSVLMQSFYHSHSIIASFSKGCLGLSLVHAGLVWFSSSLLYTNLAIPMHFKGWRHRLGQ